MLSNWKLSAHSREVLSRLVNMFVFVQFTAPFAHFLSSLQPAFLYTEMDPDLFFSIRMMIRSDVDMGAFTNKPV